MAKIGIKIANGEFYPILDECSASGKQLKLTTIRDGQTSAQIDLYRNSGNTMTTARYLGSIVVDNLQPRYAEETAISLKVMSATDGRVTAEAFEEDGEGSPQKLEVASQPADDDLDDDDLSSFMALELDTEPPETDTDITDTDIMEETDRADDEPPKRGKKNQNKKSKGSRKRRMSPAVPIVIAVVLFLLVAAAGLFLFIKQGSPWPANWYDRPSSSKTESSRAKPPEIDEAAGAGTDVDTVPVTQPVETAAAPAEVPPEPVITPPPEIPAAKTQTGGAARKGLRGESVNLASRAIGH